MTRIVHYKEEPYDVYIGRPSKWGNPYLIGRDGTREEVISKYGQWIYTQPNVLYSVNKLRDKTLGCSCRPLSCHGDVFIKILDDTISSFKGGYRFLSNFYPVDIFYDGKVYPSSEHLYQALKTHDLENREKVRLCSTPLQAKRLGYKIKIRPDWESIKFDCMVKMLLLKFKQNRNLLLDLLGTGERLLIEGNTWHDNEWGSCVCYRCLDKNGKNLLGRALMLVRSILKKREQENLYLFEE